MLNSPIKSYKPGISFWEVAPYFRIGLFGDFYAKDNSKAKETSSRKMWMIAMLCDIDSPIFELPEDKRKEIIDEDFGFIDWEKNKELVDFYKEIRLTQAERSLYNWNKKLNERDKYIEDITYDVTTYDMLDKMMSATTKLYDSYFKIKEQLTNENNMNDLAGRESSLSDKGEI